MSEAKASSQERAAFFTWQGAAEGGVGVVTAICEVTQGQVHVLLLVFLSLCSIVGVLFAYLLDKNIRGSAIYQSIFYMPVVLSLAIVGFIWKSVMYSPRQGLFNVVLGRTEQGNQIDWVGNAEKIFEFHIPGLDTPLGLTKNFAAILIAMAWRHILQQLVSLPGVLQRERY